MKKNNKRSLTNSRSIERVERSKLFERKRYSTAARRQKKEDRAAFSLSKRARGNLAENIAAMLQAADGGASIMKRASAAALILKLEQAWSIGSSDAEAAAHAGITQARLSQIKQEHPELVEHAERLKQRPLITARGTIVKHLRKPRWSAWYLERKAPGEFSQNQKIEHSGSMLFSHFAGKQGNYEKVIEAEQGPGDKEE